MCCCVGDSRSNDDDEFVCRLKTLASRDLDHKSGSSNEETFVARTLSHSILVFISSIYRNIAKMNTGFHRNIAKMNTGYGRPTTECDGDDRSRRRRLRS